MTNRDKVLIRILLFIAKIAASPEWHKEIESLTNHIQFAGMEAKNAA